MSETTHWYDTAAFPALLRAARATYASAIHRAQLATGFDDIPRNGTFVIGVVARAEAPLSEVILELGLSKQAAGQLVDTLVLRGYLDRTTDTEDRRRLTVSLTERGRAVAAVTRAAIEHLDTDILACAGDEHVGHTRKTLAIIALQGRQAGEAANEPAGEA